MSASAPAAERRAGYDRWTGERTAEGWRWWVIARGNLGLALGSRWVKALLLASLIPGIVVSGLTYAILPLSAVVVDRMLHGSLFFAFLVAAVVGARLVSEDRRQGAFLAYFSRPITSFDYVAGKFVTLVLPLLFVTAAPALLAIGVDMAVDSETFADRVTRETGQDLGAVDPEGYLRQASYGDAALAVVGWSAFASSVTTGMLLGLSALVDRARTAGITWFAVVALSQVAAGILSGALRDDWPSLITWTGNLQDLSTWMLGIDRPGVDVNPWARILVLAGAGVAGVGVVVQRLRTAEGVHR